MLECDVIDTSPFVQLGGINIRLISIYACFPAKLFSIMSKARHTRRGLFQFLQLVFLSSWYASPQLVRESLLPV